MRCGKDSVCKCRSRFCSSQPARMRCGKVSPPARSTQSGSRNPHECAVAKKQSFKRELRFLVATRTNALWQSSWVLWSLHIKARRNPHECAVAKRIILYHTMGSSSRNPHECAVAKSMCSLCVFCFRPSQPARMRCGKVEVFCLVRVAFRVATRTNALWQRPAHSGALQCAHRRNPHECAVAKNSHFQQPFYRDCRNPRECAVAKERQVD